LTRGNIKRGSGAMILGNHRELRHYRGFLYDGGHGGPYWIVGCFSAGNFLTLAALKRYVDENLCDPPRSAVPAGRRKGRDDQ
jgi:hypothetical protein